MYVLSQKIWVFSNINSTTTSILYINPPTVVKNFTGKGNLNKDLMYESFTLELLTPPDLQKSLCLKFKKLSIQ